MSLTSILMILWIVCNCSIIFTLGRYIEHQRKTHRYIEDIVWRKVKRQTDALSAIEILPHSPETDQVIKAYKGNERMEEKVELMGLRMRLSTKNKREISLFNSFKRHVKKLIIRKRRDEKAEANA